MQSQQRSKSRSGDFKVWVDDNHLKFKHLTAAVENVLRILLDQNRIDYLTIMSRTKDIKSCVEKLQRKKYKDPKHQMTDISGIRVIIYFEHDIESVSHIIANAFNVDISNSMNKDELLSADQMGYRSVHFVCDVGEARCSLPEFSEFDGLKFEIQIRTVLQHAWAELAHDRDYKFSGKLPKHLERHLYLLSGMLEMADKGFSELSKQTDTYLAQVSESTSAGALNIDINSLSLERFVRDWADKNNIKIIEPKSASINYADLVRELNQFGITNLNQLQIIIPDDFAGKIKGKDQTIYGLIRHWMMINDVRKLLNNVTIDWVILQKDTYPLEDYLSEEEMGILMQQLGVEDDDLDDFDDSFDEN